ncbi:MAG TPA: ribosome biogenesis GTP-binding protein YihA/YsxC [Terriglobales bacterium]|nr:ribosome biogenesis GTP-binding protein YihA/YsxC [Terriglobales bacterium]
MRVLSRFMLAASDERHFPTTDLPEIAFLGRSNVGKSSLINSLVGNKIARTSSTPGRTRSINFFEIRWPGKPKPELIFTDLPGYGYAKLPREVSQQWPGFIEPYLKARPVLALCLVLIDSNISPQESDQHLLAFLRSLGRPFLVVATKSDRLSGNQLTNSVQVLSEALGIPRLLLYSSKSGLGRDQVWQEIRSAAVAFAEQKSLPTPLRG